MHKSVEKNPVEYSTILLLAVASVNAQDELSLKKVTFSNSSM